jgi:hypothetical protein
VEEGKKSVLDGLSTPCNGFLVREYIEREKYSEVKEPLSTPCNGFMDSSPQVA